MYSIRTVSKNEVDYGKFNIPSKLVDRSLPYTEKYYIDGPLVLPIIISLAFGMWSMLITGALFDFASSLISISIGVAVFLGTFIFYSARDMIHQKLIRIGKAVSYVTMINQDNMLDNFYQSAIDPYHLPAGKYEKLFGKYDHDIKYEFIMPLLGYDLEFSKKSTRILCAIKDIAPNEFIKLKTVIYAYENNQLFREVETFKNNRYNSLSEYLDTI